ncbi:DUF4302 domain-containing protein [Haoranjiania flava]|uniref:DUF4302 domain-containing protein n=1 Tax=Haoranjiania flava TaxID=1856322 RepID=A0AAE3INF8_9BACT|nr:DUF4302 domain-containing protein [Haoranjiania flava]MCU7694310.1 DUF4302 domain-containing protein [Haoranjiania flava]
MKNILLLFTGVLVLLSCNKSLEPDLTFGKLPEERMAERNAELKAKLLEGSNGWKAVLRTSLRGGAYGYYMQFKDNEQVAMLADWSEATAKKFDTSTYRIKYVMNTSLIFDTYNYLSILQNPTGSANGGANANGLQSDIEFEYLRSTADSIILKGKKYGNTLYMIKATADEKTAFENGEYLTAISKLKNYFAKNFPHIIIGGNGTEKKIELWINSTTKVIDGDYITPDKNLESTNSGFAYAINGAYFNSGLVAQGIKITGMKWKSDTEIVAYDSSGTEYKINTSAAPLTLLHLALGTKFKLQAHFKTIYPGTSAKGSIIVGHYVNNLDNAYSGYKFIGGALTFTFDVPNKKLTVTGWHTQTEGASIGTGGWNTVITYSYTKDENGFYKFTHLSGPALPQSGANGYVQRLMSEEGKETIDSFLRNNRVSFDYYSEGGTSYGRMTSVENPNIVMTFALIR